VDGFSWSMQGTCCWRGGSYLTKEEIGVFSVSSLFWTRVGVSVCICMCIRTHTHTLHVRVLGCEPRGRDKTLEEPEESRCTKSQHICIHICVHNTRLHVYTGRRDVNLD